MKMLKYFLLIICSTWLSCTNQNPKPKDEEVDRNIEVKVKKPQSKVQVSHENKASSIEQIILTRFPKYSLLSSFKGDLNLDALEDMVVVLQKQCPAEAEAFSSHSQCRMALFFINSGKNKYKIAGKNASIIACSDCGGSGTGDPFKGISIKNGYISFESLFGSCDKTFEVITFKYNPEKNNWFLNSIGSEDYSCNSNEPDLPISKTTRKKQELGKVDFEDFRKSNY